MESRFLIPIQTIGIQNDKRETVRIREYTPADLEALQRLHLAQGFAYDFPDLANPLFLTKLVATRTDETFVGAALVRLTAEAFLLLDPAVGAPADRWRVVQALNEAARRDAHARGLDDVHCWVPPQLERRFAKRLVQLGWRRELWPCWSKILSLAR